MKYYLPAVLALLFLTSCNRNNDEMPVCQLSANPNYYYQSGYNIQLPNAFTPNADGRNDRYRPLGDASQITNFRLTIQDKDGNTLFETTDSGTPGWDGRNSSGMAMQPGRYQARVNYSTPYGGSVSQTYCIALLSYAGASCVPQSADGTYYFEDMYDLNYGGFHYNTGESICY